MKKQKNELKITVTMALLCAMSIIMGKYLAINGGQIMRFSLENTPIIIGGMAFGPVAGMLIGICADLIGCLMVGYTINPLVTLGAAVIGLLSGVLTIIFKKRNINLHFSVILTVFVAHFIGSVIIKTLGLYSYYTMPIGILFLWRLLNYLIVGALDGVVIYALMKNKAIQDQITALKEEKK